MDLVEVNPLIKSNDDDVKKTVFSATRAILSFFGYKTLGTHDPRGLYFKYNKSFFLEIVLIVNLSTMSV